MNRRAFFAAVAGVFGIDHPLKSVASFRDKRYTDSITGGAVAVRSDVARISFTAEELSRLAEQAFLYYDSPQTVIGLQVWLK